jgi:hypothetical protein
VTGDVLSLLYRARAVFIGKGFSVDSDPLNSLGDGKSWEIVVDPPVTLPNGVDAIELAAQCQVGIVSGAPRPIWEGERIIVPLWPSGPSVSTTESTNLEKNGSILEAKVARKLQASSGNPTMTVGEVAHACGKSKSTIYRWLGEDKLRWSKVPGRILTESVKRLLEP